VNDFWKGAAVAPKTLRAVAADEKAPTRKQFLSVLEAVAEGEQRDQLVAMRTRIARAIDDPNIRGADLAALSRRLLEIGKEIEVIDTRVEEEAAESADATPDDRWQAV
jgi:hypothetical protein